MNFQENQKKKKMLINFPSTTVQIPQPELKLTDEGKYNVCSLDA